MNLKNAKSVKYVKDSGGENKNVKVEFNDSDQILCVPLNSSSTEYQEIQAWVAGGNTIEAAD